jgi:hypothetical protein
LLGRGLGEIDVRIDGMRVNDPGLGVPMLRPVAELVDGVKIETGTQSADQGGYSGGRIDFRSARGSNVTGGELRQSFMPRFARPRLTLGDDAVALETIPRFGWQTVLRVGGPVLIDRLIWSVGAVVQRSSTMLRQTFRAHPSEAPFGEQTTTQSTFAGQGFARLDWLVSPRHRAWASSFVAPRFVRRPLRRPFGPGDPDVDGPSHGTIVDPRTGRPLASAGLLGDALGWDRSNLVAAMAGYDGRVARDRLEIDARFGFVQGRTIEAWRVDDSALGDEPTRRWSDADGRSLVDVLREDDALEQVPHVVDACAEPGTCLVRRWASGGIGATQHSRSRRLGGGASLTHYFTWLGDHAMRYAVEAEHTERVRSLRHPGESSEVRRVAAQNYAAAVQDRWHPFPDLALVPGVRWEAQDIRDANGRRIAAIADNVSPRVAASYDWTGEGKSWLHASYGHHVQQFPLALFEGGVQVAPELRGQYDAQTVVGYAQEIVDDVILGVSWTHRELGRGVVPVAVGRERHAIANAGRPHLQRNSDAFTFELSKRFARMWMLAGSYTYAREIGNFDGLADPHTGAIDRSQRERWASPELQRNGFGPSTTSAPHRLAADLFRIFAFGDAGSLWVGAGVRVFSGPPVSVRAPSGRHPDADHPVHVLPRGSGGRLPPLARMNLHLHYDYPLTRAGMVLGVGARLFNVTNAQPATRVDERYTLQGTRAIAGGDLTQLRHAKVQRRGEPDRFFDRRLVQPAAGFGRVVARQQPVAGQLDVRILF